MTLFIQLFKESKRSEYDAEEILN